MAKKKIREEFNKYFSAGNETMIKKMLKEYPWLLQEQQIKIDINLEKQGIIISALGVMNDENGGLPASIEDIIFCLRADFKQPKKNREEIVNLLHDAEILGYCTSAENGWVLTIQGERICDNYLNSHIEVLGSELE